MKRIALYLFLSLFIFASCHRQKPKTISRTSPANDSASKPDYYKHFLGTIDGKPLLLELICYDGKYSGYYYTDDGRPVALQGVKDAATEIVNLDEISSTSLQNDSVKYTWKLQIKADSAWGQKINAKDKSTALVQLKESYKDEAAKLDVFYQSMIAAYHEEIDTPYAENSVQWIYPKDTDTQKFIVAGVFKMVHCDTATAYTKEGLSNCLSEKAEDYFREYRETIGLLDEGEEELKSETNNFSYVAQQHVVWNANKWLVLEKQEYDYTGGAHGNTVSTYYNFDLQNQKQWSLADIINPDTNKLKVLLDMAARKYFALNDTQPLQNKLLVNKVPVTDNFFITPAGIVFCYLPYELASFSDGDILLFISYHELDEMLTPAFKERMKITGSAGGKA